MSGLVEALAAALARPGPAAIPFRDAAGDPAPKNPITGIAGCCARATSGHAAAAPSRVMNSRRLIAAPEALH